MNLPLLRAKIVEEKKTQKYLAEKKGCTLNTMNRLLHGKIKMNIDDALFFCEELNIKTDKEKCQIFLPELSLNGDEEHL